MIRLASQTLVCRAKKPLWAHSFQHPPSPSRPRRCRQAWSRTVGPSQSWVVDYAITALAFGICIVYACFIGDTFTSLLKGRQAGGRRTHRTRPTATPPHSPGEPKMTIRLHLPACPNPMKQQKIKSGAGLPPALSSRSASILGVTALVLFPLTLLKDLSSLQYSSYVGIAAVFYTVLFIAKRYYDGSYAPGAELFRAIPEALRPKPAAFGTWQVGCGARHSTAHGGKGMG